MPQGFTGLFAAFLKPALLLFFFCHTFCKPATPKAQSHPRSCGGLEPFLPCKAKSRCTPTATTVSLVPEKNNPMRLIHNVILYNRPPACILPAIPRHANALSSLYKHIILSRHPLQPALPTPPEGHNSPPPC